MDLANERPLAKIVPAILNSYFAGAEPEFVVSQAVIAERSPAKVKACDPIRGITLDRFPHYQLIRVQIMERSIRSGELVDGLAALVEKHAGGERNIPNPAGSPLAAPAGSLCSVAGQFTNPPRQIRLRPLGQSPGQKDEIFLGFFFTER